MKPLSLRPLAALAMAGAMLYAPALQAGEGHDHDHDAAPAATGPALPRFAATSELFELVGVLDGRQLTLYLDHAADNSPVKDATLELELGGTAVPVKPHGEGEFEAMLAEKPAPGVIPVTATVVAGQESDLLAGELDLHAEEHPQQAQERNGLAVGAWIAAGLAALAALLWAARKLTTGRRAGGAA